MGYVVLATHPILGPCAIKLLHSESARDPEVIKRFVREAQAAQRIQSEHVVRVSDVGVDSVLGAPYIVMERLQGQDLQQLLKVRGRLSVEDSVDYVLQACEALAEAHIEGIVHRDLKPANLFVTSRRDGTPFVKVLDFGISKMAVAAGDGPGGESALTRTNEIMGTVLYMSPEQLQRPKEVDARSDIWALGVILYELLSGRVPFVGDDMPNTMVKVIMEEPEPIGSLRPEVPEPLRKVIARCLKKSRDERFANVSDFASSLFDMATARGRGSIQRIVDVERAAGNAMSRVPRLPVVAAVADQGSPSPAGAAHLAARTTTSGAVSAPIAEPNTGVPKRSLAPVFIAGFAVVALVGGGAAFALSRAGGTTISSHGADTSEAQPKSDAASSSASSSPSEVASTAPSAPNSASASAPVAPASSRRGPAASKPAPAAPTVGAALAPSLSARADPSASVLVTPPVPPATIAPPVSSKKRDPLAIGLE
jgi:serine/threonine-protein kinase